MYYASIGMLSIIVHLIINFEAMKVSLQKKADPSRNRYRQFLYAVTIYYITDILWGILYEHRLILLTYIDTTVYFLSMMLSVLLWTRFVVSYLDNKKLFGKVLLGSGWLLMLYQIIVLIINLFDPLVFGFDEQKEYVAGAARFISLGLQMILFFLTSLYALFVAAKTDGAEKEHHRTVGYSGIVMTGFIALQSLYPLLPFYAAGCLLATCMIHSFVYKDETLEYGREIEVAVEKSYRDALTGVKNKLAYLENIVRIEKTIESGQMSEYGVVVFDLNRLKQVNDTQGHDAGDEYIKLASGLICNTYKHSPVYRIGGDEFAVILEGEDYRNRAELMDAFEREVDNNQKTGGVVVSGGMAVYQADKDSGYNDVFKRADRKMYERKKKLHAVAG
ncbi:MAG: GGDEF domain-containing protein [Lachnospiraceae bacterium]|nr:GGDEF domain-containing protein [Lachnospiraceae bacterium]